MIPAEKTDTTDALDMLEDISARARAMKLGLAFYTVEDVEAVCAALRAVRRNPVAMAVAPVSAPLDREVIARVIETTYWPLVDKWGRNTSNEYWNTRIEASLAKADAILALSQQDQVGLTTPAVEGRGGPCPALPADGSDNGKREPPGPVNCNVVIRREAIKPYPRTCARCGLGPCPFYNKDRTVKP